jgi:hypothetical protein
MSTDGSRLGDLADLAEIWRRFAANTARNASPIYETICHAVAGDAELLALAAESPPESRRPPMLLAAAHYLLLARPGHPLGRVYAGSSTADPVPLFRDICLTNRGAIVEILQHRRNQTNEVRRSTLIAPALAWVAAQLGEPMDVVDVGCSAGLNLLIDRYLLDYGEAGRTGPADAPVTVSCAVVNGAPPIRDRVPAFASRIGVDVQPPDLGRPDDVRWLLACTWPGAARMEHMARAITLAQAQPPKVVAGDAAATLPTVVDRGATRPLCVVTTWLLSHLALRERACFVDRLGSLGQDRPVAWVACESDGVVDLVDPGPLPEHVMGQGGPVTGVIFNGGRHDGALLAYGQTHGDWIDWRA